MSDCRKDNLVNRKQKQSEPDFERGKERKTASHPPSVQVRPNAVHTLLSTHDLNFLRANTC